MIIIFNILFPHEKNNEKGTFERLPNNTLTTINYQPIKRQIYYIDSGTINELLSI